jgi:hypothetical protein
MRSQSTLKGFFLSIVVSAYPGTAQGVVHAVAGAVTRVDSGGKTLAVKTADGTEEVFKWAKTSIRRAKEADHAAFPEGLSIPRWRVKKAPMW